MSDQDNILQRNDDINQSTLATVRVNNDGDSYANHRVKEDRTKEEGNVRSVTQPTVGETRQLAESFTSTN